MARCKGCGAEIQWIEFAGKPHPIDTKPKKGFMKAEGKSWRMESLYESHFSTCPKASEFRKGKE